MFSTSTVLTKSLSQMLTLRIQCLFFCSNSNKPRYSFSFSPSCWNKEVRTPGFEPGQEAWRASIITTRSHPHSVVWDNHLFVWLVVDINSLFIIFFIKHPSVEIQMKKKKHKGVHRRRFKSLKGISDAIGGAEWYTHTKDGHYTHAACSWKVDGNKQSISSVNDHQKVELPAIYQMGTLLVSTREPVYHT